MMRRRVESVPASAPGFQSAAAAAGVIWWSQFPLPFPKHGQLRAPLLSSRRGVTTWPKVKPVPGNCLNGDPGAELVHANPGMSLQDCMEDHRASRKRARKRKGAGEDARPQPLPRPGLTAAALWSGLSPCQAS